MADYFDVSPQLANDQLRRLPCQALIEGREALLRDAEETNTPGGGFEARISQRRSQRWMWPGPGDLEPAKIGGRNDAETVYDIKLLGAVLDNVWERSLKEVAAEPFVNQPTLDGWPEQMVKRDKDGLIAGGWVTSLGSEGRNLLDIWRDAFFQKIALGVHFELLDLPTEVGGDPYWASVNPEQITRLVPPLPGGLLREVAIRVPAGGVTQEAIADPAKIPDPPKSTDPAAFWIRVYRISSYLGGPDDGPVHFRHVSKSEEQKVQWVEDKWQPLEARSGTFVPIPLLPFYGNRIAAYRGWPEFADATSLQMDLWRSMADYGMRKVNDYRNLLAISGASLEKIQSGSDRLGTLIAMGPAEARAVQIETTGAAQEAARADHDSTRARIRWMLMRTIQQQVTARKTATEINADTKGAGSWLESQVMMDIGTVQTGLEWTAQLGGLKEAGTVGLAHDFTQLAGSFDSLTDLYKEDKCPDDLYWRELHRLGGIAAVENPEKIAKQTVAMRTERDGLALERAAATPIGDADEGDDDGEQA